MMFAIRVFSIAMLLALLIGCGSGTTVPATPDGTVQKVSDDLAADKPQVVWHALPASYQADVKEVIQQFADKMDREVWNKSFVVLGKLTQVAKEQKEFVFGAAGESPLAQMNAEKVDELNENWDRVVVILETIVNSEIKTVEGLRNLDPERFLATTGSRLSKDIKELAKLADEEAAKAIEKMDETKTTVVTSEADKATVKIKVPGQPEETMEMVKVEGKWLPAEMVANWDTGIAQMKQGISQIDLSGPAKEQYLAVLTEVEQSLDQMLAAKTQEEFNQAVEGLGPMMMGFAGAGFPRDDETGPDLPSFSTPPDFSDPQPDDDSAVPPSDDFVPLPDDSTVPPPDDFVPLPDDSTPPVDDLTPATDDDPSVPTSDEE